MNEEHELDVAIFAICKYLQNEGKGNSFNADVFKGLVDAFMIRRLDYINAKQDSQNAYI